MAVINGTSGHDSITGTPDADQIFGGAGSDSLYGGAGSDSLYGGAGNDTLIGGAGADRLEGGSGTDTADYAASGAAVNVNRATGTGSGGAGADTLQGGSGANILSGGAGTDLLIGGIGPDRLYGGADADTIIGRAGNVVDGGEDGEDDDVLDLSGAGNCRLIRDPLNPENGRIEFLDAFGNVTGTLEFRNIEAIIACFTPGTPIDTGSGRVRVERLRPGDRVLTRDRGLQPVRWVGVRTLPGARLAADPALQPEC